MTVKGRLLIVGVAGGMLPSARGPAVATPPLPDPPSGATPYVQRVEVPVPLDDTTTELLQMQAAAVIGALVGGVFTAVRLRRRWAAAQPAGTGMIDLDLTMRPADTSHTRPFAAAGGPGSRPAKSGRT